MDGILVLHKPTAITSAKALYRVRKLTGIRKSGHAGTLDPLATGVLLICCGRATRLVERLMDLPKVYRATARLDLESDSHDADGPVRRVSVSHKPTPDKVRQTLERFEGVLEQVPPAISAIKVRGRPAYKHARRGRTLLLPARQVRVYRLALDHYAWPEVRFEMDCGRGTYVRSLVRDLGTALGTGGCLTALERRAIGPFTHARAHPLDALTPENATSRILPIEVVLQMLEAEPPLTTVTSAR